MLFKHYILKPIILHFLRVYDILLIRNRKILRGFSSTFTKQRRKTMQAVRQVRRLTWVSDAYIASSRYSDTGLTLFMMVLASVMIGLPTFEEFQITLGQTIVFTSLFYVLGWLIAPHLRIEKVAVLVGLFIGSTLTATMVSILPLATPLFP